MKMSQMFPSNYLGKDDLPAPITTTILKVTQEELKSDEGKELKTVLYFAGIEKAFICNKTNAFCLVDAYGDDSDFWAGKPVEIYVDPSVSFGGKRVGGLRLRIPHAGAVPRQAAPAWTFAEAVAAAAPHGITREALIAGFKSRGLTKWEPVRDTATVQQLIRDAQAMRREPGDESFDTLPPGSEEFA